VLIVKKHSSDSYGVVLPTPALRRPQDGVPQVQVSCQVEPVETLPKDSFEKPCFADQTLRQAQDNAFGMVRNISYL
jgi:hypothetical protein